jgi:hypothetical protein
MLALTTPHWDGIFTPAGIHQDAQIEIKGRRLCKGSSPCHHLAEVLWGAHELPPSAQLLERGNVCIKCEVLSVHPSFTNKVLKPLKIMQCLCPWYCKSEVACHAEGLDAPLLRAQARTRTCFKEDSVDENCKKAFKPLLSSSSLVVRSK